MQRITGNSYDSPEFIIYFLEEYSKIGTVTKTAKQD